MAEQATSSRDSAALRDAKAALAERRIARGVAWGLPLVTAAASVVAGVILGPSMAILILAAGMLLAVIALFWASLRVLSGDAPLPPELSALDAGLHAVDALSSRKQMLVRALKDLDNERALGKLEALDYEQLSTDYRAMLKDVLKQIDASLDPHRDKAEAAARSYLARSGLDEHGTPDESDGAQVARRHVSPSSESTPDDDEPSREGSEPTVAASADASKGRRVECSSCKASNELDARFCKTCGAPLADAAAPTHAGTKVTADEP